MGQRSTGVRRHAIVDLGRIVANAEAAADAPLTDSTADLRADAYGHGLLPVARALRDAGVGGFLVSRFEDAAELADAGLPAVLVGSAAGPLLGPTIYGLDPTQPSAPTLRLVGEVVAVKRVEADRGVSYGYTYRTGKPTTLALVALGFADGIPRVATNRAPVRIGAFTGRVTGRIAMDQFVVDIDDTFARPGDPAVLFGDPDRDEPSIHDWSSAVGIAAPVIVSRLGRRIERHYSA
ncbi:alanine racemase C-terminal domain-containing protein [Leifsonia poae]|uniref:alanine racemase C-terminal domain-containing protein n=1 Tax=Leifsonia poae TaxID=110933 RepID=UPI001CBB4CE9|nr:alanine racemase C-terminal domain-containing protein [Leifsonia poae]